MSSCFGQWETIRTFEQWDIDDEEILFHVNDIQHDCVNGILRILNILNTKLTLLPLFDINCIFWN